jgi:hypothetical protein
VALEREKGSIVALAWPIIAARIGHHCDERNRIVAAGQNVSRA